MGTSPCSGEKHIQIGSAPLPTEVVKFHLLDPCLGAAGTLLGGKRFKGPTPNNNPHHRPPQPTKPYKGEHKILSKGT